MIDTIVKEEQKQEITFPCLMKNTTSSLIILATGFTRDEEHMEGTVIVESEFNRLGIHSIWMNHYFEVFTGSITLQNIF